MRRTATQPRRRRLRRYIRASLRRRMERVGCVRIEPPPAPVAPAEGIPRRLLRPGGTEATVWCRYGSASMPGSMIVLATPETRTPSWWRARLPPGPFELDLHPLGLEGVRAVRASGGQPGRRADPTRGLRTRVSLGRWPSVGELPTSPIDCPPAEVRIVGPGGTCRATLQAGGTYQVDPLALAALAPPRAAKVARAVRVELPDGRMVDAEAAGQGADGMQRYRVVRR